MLAITPSTRMRWKSVEITRSQKVWIFIHMEMCENFQWSTQLHGGGIVEV